MATVLVTGANRGIGLELSRQLAERGDHVIAVCRETSPELDKLGVRVEAGVDVTKEADIAALAKRVGGERLDVLVNNAGVLLPDAFGGVDFERVRAQLEVNAIGPVRVTQALRNNLAAGSKVVLVTSRMGSIADNTSGAMYGYRMSKAALNAAGASLAHDLKSHGVAVVILHPGFVRTGMTSNRGAVEPADAARSLIARIDELTLESTGRFLHANGETLPW